MISCAKQEENKSYNLNNISELYKKASKGVETRWVSAKTLMRRKAKEV